MAPSDDVTRPSSAPRRSRLVRAGRALVAACMFAGGLLAAGMFSSSVPAAPQDCLPPPVGCVTTSVPSLPLPTVTAPTLPLPTTTTTGSSTSDAAGGTSPTGTKDDPSAAGDAAAALTVRATLRVRGTGARRVVEIRLSLAKDASVSALLSRSGSVLARRLVDARAGSSLVVLHVARAAKPGLAKLLLTCRSASGQTARASYRLRLPR